ncbi:MAG TPA: autotransporter domain-containing protein, partial [Phenylobacterium sp.]|nr:autotransporter domain-containing protein [Phenylobacterium sp.]
MTAAKAHAETVITTAVTTPLATATAANGGPDDLRVAATGSVKPTSGTAVTLNSNNRLTVEGAVAIQNADNATAVLVQGGRTGELKLSGALTVDETYEPADADKDGDLDGAFAKGTGRYGVRVTGADAFHGAILSTGAITVEGNDSAGILLETAIDGALKIGGVAVTGDRSFGVRARGSIGGDVLVNGNVQAIGKDA